MKLFSEIVKLWLDVGFGLFLSALTKWQCPLRVCNLNTNKRKGMDGIIIKKEER